MQVTLTISELTQDEEAGLRLRWNGADPVGSYAAQITAEVETLAERAREERVTAQRALGEVLVQLPPAEQDALKADLIARARANNIDTSGLEEPTAG